jgi:hypothetical protein
VLSGKQASQGYEFDFNWVVTPELQFFGGYGYNDTEVVSNAQAPHLEGYPLRRSPKDNVGVAAKYEFKQGPAKGVYATAGYKAYGRSIANPSTGRSLAATAANPVINNPMPNGRLPFPNQPAGATDHQRHHAGSTTAASRSTIPVTTWSRPGSATAGRAAAASSTRSRSTPPTSGTCATPTAPPATAPPARTSSPTI